MNKLVIDIVLGPDPPPEVTLQDADKTSLVISWDMASCGELRACSSITSYSYKLVEMATGVVTEKQTAAETSVTISNLTPCTIYKFSVAATGNLGMTGAYSEPITATTADEGM